MAPRENRKAAFSRSVFLLLMAAGWSQAVCGVWQTEHVIGPSRTFDLWSMSNGFAWSFRRIHVLNQFIRWRPALTDHDLKPSKKENDWSSTDHLKKLLFRCKHSLTFQPTWSSSEWLPNIDVIFWLCRDNDHLLTISILKTKWSSVINIMLLRACRPTF